MLLSRKRIISVILGLALLLSALTLVPASASSSSVQTIFDAGGWFESAYAEWTPIDGADSYSAYISQSGTEAWQKIDSALIRRYSDFYRVDAVGLVAGAYKIKIIPIKGGVELTDSALVTDGLTVLAYDRSGYAHFGYTEGVGAYNDDGTLKDGAIVLYVTEENKNSVSVTSKDGTTVVGIGNILNSVGMDVGRGVNSKGGIANTNSDILRKLASDGTPLVIRIIGNVTAPAGLTAYDSVDFGGSVGDNGFMARMSGGKDITVEGIGYDAVMNGWGLHFICQTSDYQNGFGKSFEVRNIAFKNVPEDCVGMEGQQNESELTAPVERCWIHNCTFYAPVIANPAESDKNGGDGACDFKRGQYFTNSYCYYIGYHKTNLVGSSDTSLQYHMTYHHNYWKDCESRGPLARQANIHMYNNVFEGQTSYCMNPRANAYIFSEYNLFYQSKNPVEVKSGAVKSYNDSFTSCTGNNHSTQVTDRSEAVSSGNKYENFDTSPTLSYIPSGNYVIQESIAKMKAQVMAYAGTQKENILDPSEVNTSVIPTSHYPKAAVTLDFSIDLNKTNIPSSGTYGNIVFNVSKFDDEYIGVGGSQTGCNIVFYVGTEVNVTVTQHSGSSYDSVLCNAYGECLLVGGGTVENLPSGYYFIQSDIYDVGSGKYKEAKLSGLTITAVDPNSATNPIPKPPVSGGDSGSGDSGSGDSGSGDSGSTDSPVTGGTVITADSEIHSFTKDGKTDPEGFFSIVGNTSTSKGSVTFLGETLTTCLKIESSTKITFTAAEDGVLVLVFGGSTSASGKAIKVDGSSYDIPSSEMLELSLKNGSHTLSKDDSINLFYMAFVPTSAAEHTHSYSCKTTIEATCEKAGLITYTCECGESYTEATKALGHSYTSETTVEATCEKAGLLTYTCECGESYTESTKALGHSYESGVCVNCNEEEVVDTPNPDDPDDGKTDAPTEDGSDPEDPNKNDSSSDDTSSDNTPADPNEDLGFFARIWRAIVEFFRRLFGKSEA
jgi:pectate lyase